MCVAGQHPYDTNVDADAEGEIEDEIDEIDGLESLAISTPTKKGKLSGAQAWDLFREQNGEGTLGSVSMTGVGHEVVFRKDLESNLRGIERFLVGRLFPFPIPASINGMRVDG